MSFVVNIGDTTKEDDTSVTVVSKPTRKFVPTEEQENVRKMAVETDILKVQAVSGSGKTSTLVYVSEAPEMQLPSLYMAFNKSMADEAGNKFGDHVECMTTHSLAYRKVGKGYQHKLSRPTGRYVNVALTGSEVAKFFRLPDFEVGDKEISKNLLGLIIKETVGKYEMSDDESLSEKHLPYTHIIALEKKYGDAFPKNKFKKFITRQAVKLWEERTDKYSEVCCTHNTYLKLYQLSKPELFPEYSIIYMDEAQDLNPVTRNIVLQQQGRCKLIFVGDKFQQIFSWNGSINALQNIHAPKATLSQSFRFGESVAELASMILGDEAEVKGNPALNTKVGADVVDYIKPHTLLFRTNMELIFTAVKLIKEGKNVSVNIDMKDFVSMLKSTHALYMEDMKQVKHENIIPFSDFKSLVEEGENRS